MTTAALVSLIVGILGLIFKEVQAYNQKVQDDIQNKLQELRKAVAKADPPTLSGVLSDQHDRMSEALRSSSRD